jgi:hypothetical protein
MFNAVSSRPSLACGGAKQYWAGLDEVEANIGQLSKQGIEEGSRWLCSDQYTIDSRS